MKIKKEKYESLRLELQEFTPQEYCVTCYFFDCIGNSSGRTKLTKNNNKKDEILATISHGSHEVSVTPPVTIESGYIWSWQGNQSNLTNSAQINYINYNGTYHVGSSNTLRQVVDATS